MLTLQICCVLFVVFVVFVILLKVRKGGQVGGKKQKRKRIERNIIRGNEEKGNDKIYKEMTGKNSMKSAKAREQSYS